MGFWERWRDARDAKPGVPGDLSVPSAANDDDGPAPDVAAAPGAPADPPAHPEPELEPEAPRDPIAEVAPVTQERIAETMRRHSYHYLVDERGDLCGLWSYRFFSFHLLEGRIFQVRGRWTRLASIERLWEILELCEAWNRRNRYPKCYVRVQDDGRVHVMTEVAVPIGAGLTDAQLDYHVQLGLGAGSAVFDELDRHFPDPIAQGPDS